MVTKFKNHLVKTKSCQEHRHIICVDGTVFPQSLWRSKQEEPFGIQGVFGGELQTTDG